MLDIKGNSCDEGHFSFNNFHFINLNISKWYFNIMQLTDANHMTVTIGGQI